MIDNNLITDGGGGDFRLLRNSFYNIICRCMMAVGYVLYNLVTQQFFLGVCLYIHFCFTIV